MRFFKKSHTTPVAIPVEITIDGETQTIVIPGEYTPEHTLPELLRQIGLTPVINTYPTQVFGYQHKEYPQTVIYFYIDHLSRSGAKEASSLHACIIDSSGWYVEYYHSVYLEKYGVCHPKTAKKIIQAIANACDNPEEVHHYFRSFGGGSLRKDFRYNLSGHEIPRPTFPPVPDSTILYLPSYGEIAPITINNEEYSIDDTTNIGGLIQNNLAYRYTETTEDVAEETYSLESWYTDETGWSVNITYCLRRTAPSNKYSSFNSARIVVETHHGHGGIHKENSSFSYNPNNSPYFRPTGDGLTVLGKLNFINLAIEAIKSPSDAIALAEKLFSE